MSTSSWDLAACVDRLVQFRRARDWERFHTPKELATALAIEAAELQETMLWKSNDEVASALSDEILRSRFEEEIADVAIFVLMIAERTSIDLRSAIDRKIDDNERRYSVEKHRGIAEKEPK
jgi:NTP pyrophosphatase (non-canonical NTP hydrolase)